MMNTTYLKASGIGILAASSLIAVDIAVAQEIEEVVVTARQREERLVDVPASITAFTAETLESAGVARAEDFVRMTPGVSMTNTAEAGDTQVSIRGLNGARDAETNFAFIIDGILYTNPSAFNREFVNLRQIEVLKGPQGALYGRSAAAGAIIVTTEKPGEEFNGEFKVSGGGHGTYTGAVTVNGPLVADQLYGQIHADYRNTDGFFHNYFVQKDNVDDFEQYNVSGRLVWEPNEDFTADAKFRYGEVDAAAISFNASLSLPPFVGFLGPLAFENVNEHDFAFHPNVDPENEQETKEFSLKLDYDMGWASATAWMLYSNIEQYFLADGTSAAFGFFNADPVCQNSLADLNGRGVRVPPPFNLVFLLPPYSPSACDGYQYQERNQEDISFEVRLTSPGDQRLRWIVGFYFLDLEREVGVAQLRDDGRAQLPRSFVNELTEALVDDQFDTTVYSGFGSIDFDITDSLQFSAALRFDREERDVHNLVPSPSEQRANCVTYFVPAFGVQLYSPAGACAGGAPGLNATQAPLNPAFITNFATGTITEVIPDRSKAFEQFQPKISLRWNALENTSVFASWGIGFKSGGFNNLGARETIDNFVENQALGVDLQVNDVFDKETSNAYEIGFKSNFAGGAVTVEGAMFYTDIEDLQFFEFFVGTFGLLRTVTNVDEASILGGELAMNAAITDRWSVYGGFSVLDTEIDENQHRPNTVGNKIPFTPDFTINAGTEYRAPVTDTIEFVGRLDWNMVGETWFHTIQDQVVPATLFGGPPADYSKTKRDNYDILNLRVAFQTDTWTIAGAVNNLLDEDYLQEVITAPEFGGEFVHPSARRNWMIEASYRF